MNPAVWIERHGRGRPDEPALADGERVHANWRVFAARTAAAAAGLVPDAELGRPRLDGEDCREFVEIGDAPPAELARERLREVVAVLAAAPSLPVPATASRSASTRRSPVTRSSRARRRSSAGSSRAPGAW